MKLFPALSLGLIILCSSALMVAKVSPSDQHELTLEQQEAMAREELAQELEQAIGSHVPELRDMIAALLNPQATDEFFTGLELRTAEFTTQTPANQNNQSSTTQNNNQ
jgi:hypothetical protein